MIAEGTRIAVIDDVEWQAETAADIVAEAGLDPHIISEGAGTFGDPGQLLARVIEAGCQAVISDHRLNDTPFAPFTGAELVARLYRERIPAVLVSTFSGIDSGTSIRLHRAYIPSLVNRGHLDPEQVLRGLEYCAAELDGHVARERLARRTLVRIIDIQRVNTVPVAHAIIHTWNPGQAIRFPLSLVDDFSIREMLTREFSDTVRVFARINVGCSEEGDLFFRDFEPAPDPDIDDLES